jgi:hypothetical protein
MADALPEFAAALAGYDDPTVPWWAHRLAQVIDEQLADQPEEVRASFFEQQVGAKLQDIERLELGGMMLSAADAAAAAQRFGSYADAIGDVTVATDHGERLAVNAAAPVAAAVPPLGFVRIDRNAATGAVAVTGVHPDFLGYDRARDLMKALHADEFFPGEVGTGGRWAREVTPPWLKGNDPGRAAEQRLGPVQMFVDGTLVFLSDPPEALPGAAAARSVAAAFPDNVAQGELSPNVAAEPDEGPAPGLAR